MNENKSGGRSELTIAIQAARAAGGMLREHFRKKLDVSYKNAIEPVTELDLQSESIIAKILQNAFPSYGLLAEEEHATIPSSGSFWLIDPLDGTINYMRGLPSFTVSIALLKEGQVTLGVVYSPIGDELFVAQKDQGAWLNWLPIHVSKTTELGRASLTSGFPYDVWNSERDNLAQLEFFTKHALTLRVSGCASMDLCCVACGRLDGYWELDLQPWDMVAGALIVMEAGGKVSNVDGKSFDPLGHDVLAANPKIHKLMLKGLRKLSNPGA